MLGRRRNYVLIHVRDQLLQYMTYHYEIFARVAG